MLLLLLGLAHAADPFATDALVAVLDNGLTVVVEEDHRTDLAALHLHYGVGARDERPGEQGCAHLFEHLMFEGSRNVPGNAFDAWLTDAGGSNNAFTSADETAYHMVFPSGALDLALFLESDRMGFLGDGLTVDNLDNQRSVVLQERAEGYAEPNGRDLDALIRQLHPDAHPYGHPVIGTVADVEGFAIDGVRDFWARHYRPRNAVLGIVGPFAADDVVDRVAHWFSDVPDPGPPVARAAATEPPTPRIPNGVLEDAVEARTLYVAWPTAPVGHPDEPALDLAAWVLSGGRGTRLDDRLLYRGGLGLDAGAVAWASELSGLFAVYATTDRPSLRRVERVLDRQIARLIARPPSDDELARARASIRSGMRDALEDPESRVERLVDCQRLTGDPNCLSAEWARYEAVTATQVSDAVARWLVPERRVRLSVVPRGAGGALPGAEPVELP